MPDVLTFINCLEISWNLWDPDEERSAKFQSWVWLCMVSCSKSVQNGHAAWYCNAWRYEHRVFCNVSFCAGILYRWLFQMET